MKILNTRFTYGELAKPMNSLNSYAYRFFMNLRTEGYDRIVEKPGPIYVDLVCALLPDDVYSLDPDEQIVNISTLKAPK